MKLLKKILPLNNTFLGLFVILQFSLFYFTGKDFINYYFLILSLLVLMLAKNKTLGIMFQSIFIFVNPIVVLKTILVCALSLWIKNQKQIKIRYSTIGLIIFFIFLVYFEHNQVAALFPGLVAFSAILYYTSRIRASLENLTRILPAYAIAITVYTFIYIILSPKDVIKPIFALPIDIIQILFAVLIYSILENLTKQHAEIYN